MPGVSAEALEVGVDGGRITIEATRAKDVPGEYRYLEENRSMHVDVDLPLPADATEAGAEASVSRGVLELYLPKREDAAETAIDVVADENESDDTDTDTTSTGRTNGPDT